MAQGGMRGAAGASAGRLIPRLRMDELVAELHGRIEQAVEIHDRVQSLLDAVVAISEDLDLEQVLRRIVAAAMALADARYGAMGVLGDDGRIGQFVSVGVSEAEIAAIGRQPVGLGLLGALIRDPDPIRLADLTTHPEAAGFPPGHPDMRTLLGVPVRVHDEIFGNLYLAEKAGGGEFRPEDEAIVSALASAAGVAIDNARLYQSARSREGWQHATSEIARKLLTGDDPAEVLELVVERSRALAGAQLAALALPDPAEDGLRVAHAAGTNSGVVRGVLLPTSGSVSAEVQRSGEVVVAPDAGADQRVAAAFRDAVALGPAMFVPLGHLGRVRGVLTIANPPGAAPFSPDTVALATSFAEQAAVALELADRRRDAEMLSTFEDRDRIARDLHDLVIQRLFATCMTLEGISRLVDRPDLAGRIMRTVGDLDATIKEIRSSIFALQVRDGPEQDRSLRHRILTEVDGARDSLGFPASLHMEGLIDTDVDERRADPLIAVLREALSNAAQHSGARRVKVTVAVVSGGLDVAVLDDGIGMPEGIPRSGLANLERRAAELGGTFEVGPPSTGGGTLLRWQVPLE